MLEGLTEEKKEEVPPEKELRGVLHVSFFKGNHFDVQVEGAVGEAQVERALSSIYREIGYAKIAARRTAREKMQLATPLLQDEPVAAEA